MTLARSRARFARTLRSTCTVTRKPVSAGLVTGDLELGDAATVYTDIPCTLSSVTASPDMTIAGPIPRETATLYVEYDVVLQVRDYVYVDSTIWVVRDPPINVRASRGAHHVEVVVERRAVT